MWWELWTKKRRSSYRWTEVKKELTKPTVSATYATLSSDQIAADASSYGLGAVLMQQHGPEWRPISYASRAMIETERHYAQIEKEALAVTWACEKFLSYLLGLAYVIETDHKPLVPLLSTKFLSSLPPRFGFVSTALRTLSSMFRGSYCTQRTHSLVLHWIVLLMALKMRFKTLALQQ